ncbi:MAG: ATP-binding protein [Bacteroidaceae bacterium]|nr:ATP-binding protein [Bacteroidaceae bacterium]
MDKSVLKQVIKDQQELVEQFPIQVRPAYIVDGFLNYTFVGVRRAGKSFVMYQEIRRLLTQSTGWSEILYLDFEDNRIEQFYSADFNTLLECHIEMYGKLPRYIFLDEMQNVEGWEKFARRMADSKYRVYLTGSNAKMLSREIMTTLGGRYMEKDVYPYNFVEYLEARQLSYDKRSLLSTRGKSMIVKAFEEYMREGGLPETMPLPVKRPYLNSTLQKIYLSDIAARNKISNLNALRLMLKKMAESVRQPISYNRLTNILSSIGEKMSTATIISYVQHCEESWLILRLRNIAVPLTDKEKICKYYMVDNGILNLFLIGQETALLENMVAIELFRRYGHDLDNDTVFYYNSNGFEVDFYVPEEKLAIQVCYSIKADDTCKREVDALKKLPNVQACQKRLIITYDEEQTIVDGYGPIEVIPCWKWMLGKMYVPA